MSTINVLTSLVRPPLNRSQKINSFYKFAKWQIGSRLVPGKIIYNWIDNAKIIASPGETGVTGNIYCGLLEFYEMSYLLHVLKKDDLFIDVGANVGAYTILACAVIGARGQCFEPVPSTFDRLTMNLNINNLSKLVVSSPIALGDEKGNIQISSNKNCMNHIITERDFLADSINVNISTLDEEAIGIPFLIKIDVEGYELPVIKGAENTIRNGEVCSVIIELNGCGKKYGFDESEIVEMMSDYGFEIFSYEPFTRQLKKVKTINTTGDNTLFVRDEKRALARIESAPKRIINGVTF